MKVSDTILCEEYPCANVKHECYVVPYADIEPDDISIVMISESAPPILSDYYYAGGESLFENTTVQAFRDAGEIVSCIADILRLGVYLTTAVKCGKIGYSMEPSIVKKCSVILEKELALFPNVQTYMLMGDVAIRSMNEISKRIGEGRVVPAGPTYKIRSHVCTFRGVRVLPSYLQAGPSFFIEKSKRRMIAADIAQALMLVSSGRSEIR